ncbi:hypothetical protein B0T26DRAFT_675664 [Lasiosphaeria miniovina]|uniref:Xylanolytic transcriptional activator regulatory domain-containing protein n=1 Tax=Lasiosphaeria miniovina TaxID=1954250 RepID=A0AA40AK50_9PEZI|nr:uncharacterized protein B0T26DRAFT_675664 [Lasiosphaeria miniovina]KAK0717341.1 hypothetical protein B0T26DRAFT_675664 [Lasiosphaeria miniovina]
MNEEGRERDSASQSPEYAAKRATKCDKESPCSNCRASNRVCSSHGSAQKPKEGRQRVLISSKYERKIDHFESRLSGIEDMLRNLTTSISAVTAPKPAPESSASASSSSGLSRAADSLPVAGACDVFGARYETSAVTTPDAHGGSDEPDSAFEGQPSMTSQTAFASEFLEKAVARASLHELHPDMQSALSSLQQMAGMQNRSSSQEARFPHAKPLPKGGIRNLEMPPLEIATNVVHLAEKPPVSFNLIGSFMVINDFADRCRKVYFATEDYSLSTFTVVNAMLLFILQEKTMDPSAAGLVKYRDLCRDNLETALASLPLMTPARRETAEALLLGTTYAIQNSRFTLAWQLNSATAVIIQTLGYHRRSADATEDPAAETRSAIFWFAYMYDKALALRFGRSSIIQDYDITVPTRLGPSIRVPDETWVSVWEQWIVHAEVMGKAYEQLFSPSALIRPPEERAESARRLGERLNEVAKDREVIARQIHAKGSVVGFDTRSPYSMDMVVFSDDVGHWSAMTLLYRAIPAPDGFPSSFSPECITAARHAFRGHSSCMQLVGTDLNMTAAYIHWTLFYVPFVPLIVMFCHIIETSNLSDLSMLSEFVDSLIPVCSISDSVEKFHRVSQVLYNVARLYVEAKAQQRQDEEMNIVGNDIDSYLSQLGFMPSMDLSAQAGAQFEQTHSDMGPNIASQQLGNWFLGNRIILGLVEEDISGL